MPFFCLLIKLFFILSLVFLKKMNLYPVTVINDFYDNPEAIRQFALAQKYKFVMKKPGWITFTLAAAPQIYTR